MKTAISVPDDTFDAATKRARELGMSRSEFFSLAARRYLDELDRESVTQPGTVFVPATASGLPRDSVVNVSGLVTLDENDVTEMVGQLPSYLLAEVDQGLRRVLDL